MLFVALLFIQLRRLESLLATAPHLLTHNLFTYHLNPGRNKLAGCCRRDTVPNDAMRYCVRSGLDVVQRQQSLGCRPLLCNLSLLCVLFTTPSEWW